MHHQGDVSLVNNWINARNPEARSLLEGEGYTPERYFFRMEIELTEEPASIPVAGGFRSCGVARAIKTCEPFYETTEEAMADNWGHVPRSYEEWGERRAGSNFDPSLWFQAQHGGD